MPKKQVAVIVPMYKETLTDNELISFKQCLQVLKNYPIIIVKPNSLSLQNLPISTDLLEVINFDNKYFRSVKGYNELMLSSVFYQTFINYEYILIYQLDAYVFKDELAQWCQKGYDYIGASWLSESPPNLFKQAIALWLKLKHPNGIAYRDITRLNAVGNGGFLSEKFNAF